MLQPPRLHNLKRVHPRFSAFNFPELQNLRTNPAQSFTSKDGGSEWFSVIHISFSSTISLTFYGDQIYLLLHHSQLTSSLTTVKGWQKHSLKTAI